MQNPIGLDKFDLNGSLQFIGSQIFICSCSSEFLKQPGYV